MTIRISVLAIRHRTSSSAPYDGDDAFEKRIEGLDSADGGQLWSYFPAHSARMAVSGRSLSTGSPKVSGSSPTRITIRHNAIEGAL